VPSTLIFAIRWSLPQYESVLTSRYLATLAGGPGR